MNFSEALTALKHGEKVARVGWNHADVYVFYVKQASVPAKHTGPWAADEHHEPLLFEPFIAIHDAAKQWKVFVPGVDSLLADDWQVVR